MAFFSQSLHPSAGIWVKPKVSWTLKFAVLTMHGWLQEPCLLNIVAETCYLEHPGGNEETSSACLPVSGAWKHPFILAAAHHDKRQLVWLCDCVMIFPVLLKILAHVKHGCFLYLHSLNLCNRTLNDWFNKAKVISMSKSAVANGSAGGAC